MQRSPGTQPAVGVPSGLPIEWARRRLPGGVAGRGGWQRERSRSKQGGRGGGQVAHRGCRRRAHPRARGRGRGRCTGAAAAAARVGMLWGRAGRGEPIHLWWSGARVQTCRRSCRRSHTASLQPAPQPPLLPPLHLPGLPWLLSGCALAPGLGGCCQNPSAPHRTAAATAPAPAPTTAAPAALPAAAAAGPPPRPQ